MIAPAPVAPTVWFRLIHTPTTADDLAARFVAAGFAEGVSPLHAEGAAVDVKVCRRRRCSCGQRGLVFRPFHRAERYRGLVQCPACGFGEEV